MSFSTISHKIALLPGDGIGPEVVSVAQSILEAYREYTSVPLELWSLDLGAERYLRDRTTLPKEILNEIQSNCGAVLLGALGDPRVPSLDYAREILFGLRFGLDLFANIRPCRALDDRLVPLKAYSSKDIHFTVFRENTEGLYVGFGGQFKRGTPDEIAINEDLNTRKGVERIIRVAFRYARTHKCKTVHLADKSNAMRESGDLWRRVFTEVSREFSEIRAECVYIDALCLYLVQNPSRFEVIVTNNLFGDIITDLGAALQGGLGMAASASLYDDGQSHRVGLFEPVHGSAPDLVGQDRANPLACVLTVGLLLSHLGYPHEEKRLEHIVREAIASRNCTTDVGGTLGTRATGQFVLEQLKRELAQPGALTSSR